MPSVNVPPFARSRFTHSPLIHGGGIKKAAGGVTALTKVAEAVSTGTTITGPAGIVAGDLLVLWDRSTAAADPGVVVPTDFTVQATALTSNTRCILSWKLADGSEASATLTGMAGILVGKALIVIRGNVPITSVTPSVGAVQITGGNPTTQVVAASGGTPPLVVVGGYSEGGGSAVDPRTMSPAKDGEATSGTAHWLAWKIYDTSPLDVSVDMEDDGGANALASGFLACA